VVRKQEKQKQSKVGAIVNRQLKRLRQEDDTWEADFRALPTSMMQTETHYLGLVVTKQGGYLLADRQVEGKPSVNDLATLLTSAIRRPLTEGAHRPRRLHVRGHPQWRALFPHLAEIGIDVSVRQELPKVNKAYENYLRHMREARRAKMVKPSEEEAAVEKAFPAITKWVRGYGHIEIGDQEGFGFVVRALDYGGLVFEDDKPESLAEAMAVLEKGLAEWFEEQGIELD